MAILRTPLEVALGERLPIDFSDLDLGDLDLLEAEHEAREAVLLSDATDVGEFLFREAVRASIPHMMGAPTA